jgi:hypothetical protein
MQSPTLLLAMRITRTGSNKQPRPRRFVEGIGRAIQFEDSQSAEIHKHNKSLTLEQQHADAQANDTSKRLAGETCWLLARVRETVQPFLSPALQCVAIWVGLLTLSKHVLSIQIRS